MRTNLSGAKVNRTEKVSINANERHTLGIGRKKYIIEMGEEKTFTKRRKVMQFPLNNEIKHVVNPNDECLAKMNSWNGKKV
jgi:hypothetical protein